MTYRSCQRLACKFSMIVVLWTWASVSTADNAPQDAPPQFLATNAPNLQLVGQALFRWFGFRVYEARLWTTNGQISAADPISQPLSLALTYARALEGAKIAEQSTKEILALGLGDDLSRARWDEAMKSIFPNVNKGDTLTGLANADRATQFYLNGKVIGLIADAAFTDAFFAIWLHPKTSAPGLRTALLAGAAQLD